MWRGGGGRRRTGEVGWSLSRRMGLCAFASGSRGAARGSRSTSPMSSEMMVLTWTASPERERDRFRCFLAPISEVHACCVSCVVVISTRVSVSRTQALALSVMDGWGTCFLCFVVVEGRGSYLLFRLGLRRDTRQKVLFLSVFALFSPSCPVSSLFFIL